MLIQLNIYAKDGSTRPVAFNPDYIVNANENSEHENVDGPVTMLGISGLPEPIWVKETVAEINNLETHLLDERGWNYAHAREAVRSQHHG